MEITGIPERNRNTWRKQKYLVEVRIHRGSRNTGKFYEYIEGAEIPERIRNTRREQKYREEV